MTCDELRPDYEAFALGVLEEPERTEMRAHLARGCDVCAAGVRDAQAVVALFGASTAGPPPPARLRRRVLASTIGERGWDWRRTILPIAATSAIALLLLFYTGRNYELRIASLRREVAQRSTEAGAMREALAVLQGPDTREVTFGGERPTPPRGRVFINPSSGILLIASNLPAPPAGKAYEMWILPKSGNPLPAGLFTSGTDGTALHLHKATVPITETAGIAVTLEVAEGVSAPTSTPVIVARL